MERKRKTSTSSSTSSGRTPTPTSSSHHQTSPGTYYYTTGSRKVNVHKPPYTEEWSRCFHHHGRIQLKILKQHAVDGDLRSSKMRSIYWRLFLRILPLNKDEWFSIVERYRYEYKEIKAKHSKNPKDFNEGDPQSNNPLSLQENCPWRQFFYNSELKEQIKKDVDRSFPEVPFFKNSDTREIMINVLFIYAKEHPHIEYKQGMHEILGPLLFVLNYDQENFLTLREANVISSLNENDKRLLGFLNDPHFREHDVYQMFVGVMLLIEGWYIYGDENLSKSDDESSNSSSSNNNGEYICNIDNNLNDLKRKRKLSINTYQSNLFKQSLDTNTSKSLIIDKLKEIMEVFLKEYDNILYNHLKNLNIPPQVYGIRWLRLLFGREFPFSDLLYIWDVILSDDDPLIMVDFIFLSLLLQIRDQLLSSDYSCCLQFLMRYPPIIDVINFVRFSLHIRSPKKYPMPKMSGPMNFSNITLSGQVHPNTDKKKYISIFNEHKEGKKVIKDKENDSVSIFSQTSSNENWDECNHHHSHKNSSIENIKNSPEYEMISMNRRHTFTNGARNSKLSTTEIQEYEAMKKQIDSLQQVTINLETKQFEASQRLHEIISGIKQLNIEKEIKKQLIKSIWDVAQRLTFSSINEASIRNVTLPTDASPTREGVEVAIEAKSPDNV